MYRKWFRMIWMLALIPVLIACSSANPQQPGTSAPSAETGTPVLATNADAGILYNLNTASSDELASIPGVSARMVREFMEYRPYVSIEQFRREIGKYVDAAQVAAYEKYVFVPVDVDESDAATLMQLPGVDQANADSLIAGRPYGTEAAFLDAFAELVPASDPLAIQSYLVP